MKIFRCALYSVLLLGCLGVTPSSATTVDSLSVVRIDFDFQTSGPFNILQVDLPTSAPLNFPVDGWTATAFDDPSTVIGTADVHPGVSPFNIFLTSPALNDGIGFIILSDITGSFDLLTNSVGVTGGCFTGGPGPCQTASVDAPAVDVTIRTTPLPAALPLFLTFLSGLGLLKWRRNRAFAV